MLTGTYDGKNVYGPRPSEEAMRQRAKRDNIEFDFKPGLELHQKYYRYHPEASSAYYVEVWIRFDRFGRAWCYRTRRDGRISIGSVWRERDEIVILEVA